ncbi:MAG: hypothetical protein VKL20_05360 [Synechocystis sp.]|nr:hypothetical protein [Synechocystis sp.]
MSPDLLLKLIAIPAMLYLVNLITGAKADQSLSELAVSVQYEALRDVAGTTYEESFYSADQSEEGLEANINDGAGYATRVSYFDYADGIDLARERLIAQLADDSSSFSILDASFTEGIDGYIDVLIAGGTLIEEDGSFFENALWGEAGTGAGSYFSGLSGFNLTGGAETTSSTCRPYDQIQKVQSRLKAQRSNLSELNPLEKGSDINQKLVDPDNLNPLSSSEQTQSPELDMADLVDAVATAQQSSGTEMAIAKTDGLNECFIAKAKTVFDAEQIAIAPIKQMPNLAYYDYFYSTTKNKVNIEDGSASFFLFRNTEPSPEDVERRRQLYQTARQQVSKWNAF